MLGGNITLQVYESTDKEIWSVFREHHYLTADFNKGAKLYLAYWNDVLVAMFSILNQPNGSYKYGYRIHRIVVLPDFQGLGIGTRLLDSFGERILENGDKLFIRTTHVRISSHCIKSESWEETSHSRKTSDKNCGEHHLKKYKNYDLKRVAYSFEYVGENYKKIPHQLILCLGEATEEFTRESLLKIIKKDEFPIVVTGVADLKQINVWEEVAKEMGIRTELLFIKAKGELSIVKKYLTQDFDAIIIGKDNQDLISQYKHAKDIRQLITYNYKHKGPEYFEKLI